MKYRVKKLIMVISLISLLFCSTMLPSGAASEATEIEMTTSGAMDSTGNESSLATGDENNGFDMKGYLIKGGVVLGVGVVLYVIVAMRSRDN